MRTFRVKAFLFVEAASETAAEEIAEEVLSSISKDREKVRVRKGSAKLIPEKEETKNGHKSNAR